MPTIVHAETEAQYQQIQELMTEFIAWDGSQVKQRGLDAQEMMDFYYHAHDDSVECATCRLLADRYLLRKGSGLWRIPQNDR
jgi:hypothetical protein